MIFKKPKEKENKLMNALLLTMLAFAPPSGGTNNVITGQYYAPDPAIQTVVMSTVGSADHVINVAASSFCSSNFVNALCMAATNGVAVTACLSISGGSNTCNYIHARQLVASGGTVLIGTFSHTAANRFVTLDSVYTMQGTYYWSDGAVQAGNDLTTVSGSNLATQNNTQFQTLVMSCTPYSGFLPLATGRRYVQECIPLGSIKGGPPPIDLRLSPLPCSGVIAAQPMAGTTCHDGCPIPPTAAATITPCAGLSVPSGEGRRGLGFRFASQRNKYMLAPNAPTPCEPGERVPRARLFGRRRLCGS
jgi:hypothetical protein